MRFSNAASSLDSKICLTIVSMLLLSGTVANAQDFPQFRGAGGMGMADLKLGSEFSVENNLDWKKEIEGAGWSQPVIWKDKIFVTVAVAANDFKPKNFAGGVQMPQSMGTGGPKPDFEVDWKVVCLNVKSGDVLWTTPIKSQIPEFAIHPSNSYATETPAVDADGVYAYFGAIGQVVGLSHDGKLKWQKEVGAFKTGNDFGTGSSMAIADSKVFVQNFSEESGDVWCFNTADGEVLWQKKREGAKTSWSSPIVWDHGDKKELIVSGGDKIDSFNIEDGGSVWSLSKVKAATACSVCVDGKQIYFGGSDPMSKGPLFAVKPGGSGEIAPKRTNQTFDNCAWRQPRSAPGMASPVSSGDFVYVVDRTILRCHDAATGEKVYENRLTDLKMIVACPLICGDDLVLVDEDGGIGAVKIGKEFEFRMIGNIDDTVWASPAATNDALFVRGVNGLYRLGLK